MNKIKHYLAEYTGFFKHVLAVTGIWGAFIIAFVDSAAFGIPLDPVMVGYAWGFREQWHLATFAVLLASVGSALGSLVPYWIGRKGGEPLLLKRITHARLEELRDRYESWEFLFVMVPSMLPPPTPMKLIILAAGAFEMRVPLFMLALFIGRALRFGLITVLVIKYGRQIAENVGAMFREHWHLILVGALIVGLVAWWVVRWRNGKKPGASSQEKQTQ